MSEYVMHYENKNPNFSLCGKNSFTAHIRTTKDKSKVTCTRCKTKLKKMK